MPEQTASTTVLWTRTIPNLEVPNQIELVASTHAPPSELVSCAFVLAVNPARQVLLTFDSRPARGWDVPGGHLDAGESPEVAALRELREETGLVLSKSHLDVVGWTRIRLDQRPPEYRYPYPTSYMTFYAAHLDRPVELPGPEPGTECSDARWMSVDDVNKYCAGCDWLPMLKYVL